MFTQKMSKNIFEIVSHEMKKALISKNHNNLALFRTRRIIVMSTLSVAIYHNNDQIVTH